MPGLRDLIGGNGGVSGTLDQIAQQRAQAMGQRASEEAAGSEAGESDWWSWDTFDTTQNNMVEDQEVRVAEYVVPAQTGYAYGYGEPVPGKSDNQGAIYFDPGQDSGSNAVSGTLRLRSENAVGKGVEDHGSFTVARLSAPSESDPEQWHKLPERAMDIVSEDSKLYLTFAADNSTNDGNNLVDSNVTLNIAMTEYQEGGR